MAPQLWMLRHGEAVPHDSKPDDERELTPRGRRQADAAGAALAALGEEFAACYTSPKVRARETAELACARLNIEPVVEDALGDGFSRVDALALLDAHGADAHDPGRRPRADVLAGRLRLHRRPRGLQEGRRRRAARRRGPPASCSSLLRPRELEALAAALSRR